MSRHPKTVGFPLAKSDQLGICKLNSAHFTVTEGDVAIKANSIGTADLEANVVDNGQIAEDLVQQTQVTLTAAEVKALAATQKTLVAAPGAGKAIQFLGAMLKLNYGSEVFTETADNLVIKYTNASGVAVSDVVEATGFIDQSADTITNAIPVKDAIVAGTSCENQALVLDNNGDGEIAGNASNDSTLSVDIVYRVVTLA